MRPTAARRTGIDVARGRLARPEDERIARGHVLQHHRPHVFEDGVPAGRHEDLHRAHAALSARHDAHGYQRFAAQVMIDRRLDVGLECERAVLQPVAPGAPEQWPHKQQRNQRHYDPRCHGHRLHPLRRGEGPRDSAREGLHAFMPILRTPKIALQVFRLDEIGQADRLGGAALEGGAWSEPTSSARSDRDAPARGLRGDRIVGTRDAGAPVVEKIHRDLDEPAALEGQAEGLDARQASGGLAHGARDGPCHGEILGIEPDVVGDENVARADSDGAASRVECARARSRGTTRDRRGARPGPRTRPRRISRTARRSGRAAAAP